MSEASFLLTLRNFSPLWRWNYVSANSSVGWIVQCAQQVPALVRCDENTAQYTTTTASANLTFWGTDVVIHGNYTGGMNWTMTLDGQLPQTGRPGGETANVLASWHNLSTYEQHVVALTTSPGDSPSPAFTLERADVTVNTGESGNVTNTYVDDLSSLVAYSAWWYPYPEYPGTSPPTTIQNTTFHASRNISSSYSVPFNASAVIVYGPCYEQCGQYLVSLDSELPVAFNASYASKTQVGENCVLYYRTGLSSNEHLVTVTVDDPGRWTTLDWIQLVHVNKDEDGNGGSTPAEGNTASPHSTKSNVGAIAGGVIGGIVIFVLFALLLFLRRRRTRNMRSKHDLPDLVHSGHGSSKGEKDLEEEESVKPFGAHSLFPSFPSSPSPLSEAITSDGFRSENANAHPNNDDTVSSSPPVADQGPDSRLASPSLHKALGFDSSFMSDQSPPEHYNVPNLAISAHHEALGFSPPSVSPNHPVAATLSEVSRDVSRILTQLGSLRLGPRGEIDGRNREALEEIHQRLGTHGARDFDDATEPPEYGEGDGTLPRN